ncbi:MAG: hypothetical protein C4547_14740 [Phycisphaerales bacterium]|nr:MAG: hypothetical protein C4547_14740 [Phycisphaerales bacterium]
MVMEEDYPSAARRHLSDARMLLAASRTDNAAYLAGYVAECGVKAVMTLAAGFKVYLHLDQLTARPLALAADLSRSARRYPVDLDPDVESIRSGWKSVLRYATTASVSRSQAESLVSSAAAVFRKTIVALVLDGYMERMPA